MTHSSLPLHRHQLTVWTLLLCYQGLYWLYLLRVSDWFVLEGFPYTLFLLSIFTRHSIFFRGALLVVLLLEVKGQLLAWCQGSAYEQGKLLAYLLLAALFLFFDQCFGLYSAPWAFAGLLIGLLSLLLVPQQSPCFALENPQRIWTEAKGLLAESQPV